jgi:FxsC-like protein
LADVQDSVYGRLGRRVVFAGQATFATDETAGDPGDGSEISRNVLSCRVLVALYSDEYLQDRQRLAEWSLFHERVRWHRQFTGRHSPALVGVRWSLRAGEVPATFLDSGVLTGDFGDSYRETGALRLLRTAPGSGWYRSFVGRVGDLIVAAGRDPVPELSGSDVGYLRSLGVPPVAGEPSNGASAGAAQGGGPSAGTPPEPDAANGGERPGNADADAGVGVVLAVAPSSQQPARRVRREYYGEAATDWRPFLPTTTLTAFTITCRALARCEVRHAVSYSLGEDMPADLARAARTAQVLVVLVDPWVALSETYSRRLASLALWCRRHPFFATALVIVNPADDETVRNTEELRVRLRAALRQNRIWPAGRTWQEEVRTIDQFVAFVIPAVVRSRNLIRLSTRTVEADARSATTEADAPGAGVLSTVYRPRISDPERTRRPFLRRPRGGA